MSRNMENKQALQELKDESKETQISYYRKPFMVLWAAVQEAAVEVEEDYGLTPELAQLWVAERLRQVSDSLVDRLAEKAVSHGASKANVSRAADASPKNANRRFPRLQEDVSLDRLLIDEVLDTLE